MFLSVFDLFKIGIGPSSSHTMGPMVAAHRFLDEILNGDWVRPYGSKVSEIKVSLHGSLAFTGVGHATDRAVILGLCGEKPDMMDIEAAEELLAKVARSKTITPPGHPPYRFDPAVDLVLDKKTPLPGHANGMQFTALDQDGRQLLRVPYFSVGGGFVMSGDELAASRNAAKRDTGPAVPFPFASAKEMLEMAGKSGHSIAEMKRRNEETIMGREALDAGLDKVWAAMDACINRGIQRDGIMPGGLKVKRRAKAIFETAQRLMGHECPQILCSPMTGCRSTPWQ